MLSKKERAELKELCNKWHNHREYSDDYEYSSGFEAGYSSAAYELEEWLDRD